MEREQPDQGWGERSGKEKKSAQEDRREISGLEVGTAVTVWSKEGEEWLKTTEERAAGRAGPGHTGPCTMVRSLNSVLRAMGYHRGRVLSREMTSYHLIFRRHAPS